MKNKPGSKLSAEGEKLSATGGRLKTSLIKNNLRSTPHKKTPEEEHQNHLCKISGETLKKAKINLELNKIF